jgi:hypothetical protein
MPPVSPQGSRTALVTWCVVFAVLFVTSAIFAIYFYANASKATDREEQLRKQYSDLAPPNELQSDAANRLKDVRATPPEGSAITSSMPLFTVAVTQGQELSQLIGGPSANTPTAAAERAKAALTKAAQAGKEANITVPATDNLANALTTLASGITARVKEVKDLQAQLDGAKKDNAAQTAQFEQSRAEMAKQLEAIRAEQAAAQQALTAYQTEKNTQVSAIDASMASERKALQDATNAAQVQIAELNRQLDAANQQISRLQARFADKRVDTQGPVVRHADGHIVRLPAKDVVYIDLGTAQSITPGLTFEVYDRFEGVPPAGDPTTEENLPRGKASIEVIRVGQGSSECRVTRTTPGTQISEGDIVANLVYDPNTKYNFVVYGQFDLDRNNVATEQDAEVIKRLITQWGGNLMDKVNVDTDFVVLGKEPVLPILTPEERQDPFEAQKLANAQAALDAYESVRNTARDLHIPILNQNRFLYLIGYYDQAKR